MDFDPVLLARLQFAFTIIFHIIFPSFTIGLSAYLATLGVMWLRSGNDRYQHLMRFWTKIFAVSFAMGVVSGIVLSYQFGTNWSRFSVATGNVLGPLLGYEVLAAFFLEATFLGILLFGFNRVPPWLYVLVGRGRRDRHRNFRVLDPVGQQLDADADRPRNTRWHRLSGRLARRHLQSEFPVPLRAYAQRGLSHDRLRRARGWRTLSGGRTPHRGRPHHAAHGDRPDRDPCAAATGDRRPARAQHARTPADQGRGDGSALGRQQARRLPHLRLAGRKGGGEPFRDCRSRRRLRSS